MEKLTKRILAIVLIAVIGVGVGITVYLFVAPYAWGAKDVPGMESSTTITEDQIIRIGVLGDMNDITGQGAREGAYLAAKQVNLDGGLQVGGKTYYIGITSEDTNEANPNLVTSRGVAAAERLISYKNIQFTTGGFRTECVAAYEENLMAAHIPFIDTGAATDTFAQNVLNNYDKYKYFFRAMPVNSSSLGKEILYYIAGQILALNATYPNENVRTVGILAENLDWAPPLVDAIQESLPLVVAGIAINVYHVNPVAAVNWVTNTSIIANTIYYDINLNAQDMQTYLTTLENAGCDVVVPVISAQGGILMMQQYAAIHPHYLLIGVDVPSQLNTFWEKTDGACVYETILQSTYNITKTAATVAFWNAFNAEFGHDPLYTAIGSYDAINLYAYAINQSQSFNPDTIVSTLETINHAHPFTGSAGLIAFTGGHDLWEGYPYAYTLFCQWHPGNVKVVVPDYYLYSPYLNIEGGTFLVPPWIDTAWST
jgi:branched-chain amino acid transport system substrate-binding protein